MSDERANGGIDGDRAGEAGPVAREAALADAKAPAADEARGSATPSAAVVSDAPIAAAAEAGMEGEPADDRVIHDAAVGSVAGQRVAVRDSAVGVVAAGEVEAHDSLIVVGAIGSLSGEAKVLVDVPAALAFGAGLGLALALFGWLLGRARED
jgi:hypothetical protein